MHCFLSGVSRHALRLPPALAHHGSTASAAACSPFRSPSPLFFSWGGAKDLAARDSGKPIERCVSRSSSFAPWSFGPSLQRHYPPSPLLWPLLTSPSLSRRSPPQVRCCFFPLVPSGSTSYVSDGHWASLCLASLPPVRGLSAGSCSYGRRFVPRFLQLGSRRWPRDPPCGSLRLPPSVPVSTLQLTSKQPTLGTLGRSFYGRLPRPTSAATLPQGAFSDLDLISGSRLSCSMLLCLICLLSEGSESHEFAANLIEDLVTRSAIRTTTSLRSWKKLRTLAPRPARLIDRHGEHSQQVNAALRGLGGYRVNQFLLGYFLRSRRDSNFTE